ncbi:WD40-repeat-containing domain protein [Syncephalis plumigaleata]|nr:WD40-repeat-containing domain protein [Syncephalis plumigaleata]
MTVTRTSKRQTKLADHFVNVDIIDMLDEENVDPSSSEEFVTSPTLTQPNTAGKTSSVKVTKKRATSGYEPTIVRKMAQQYPDPYWQHHAESDSGMINFVNEEQHPLYCIKEANIHDQGPITGMKLSPDGTMLATFCNVGCVKLWDLEDWSLLRHLRDTEESNIDEFYVGQFTPDQTRLIVAGKLKDRNRWSEADEDNHIMETPIKIFDVVTGQVIAKLDGHEEEVICIKLIQFQGDNYIISTSQDGYIIKWKMESDWCTLVEHTRMEDGITCMAFTVSFLPNTGNRYFLAACDDGIKLFDFEAARVIQTFDNLYSSYCDCGKFVNCVDMPYDDTGKRPYEYFITRGVELLDSEDCTLATEPNSVILHKLIYPTTKGGVFKLTEEKRYQHEEYHSNSWLVKIASNGRFILAPTLNGQVFLFDIRSGKMLMVLKDSEDGTVKVYTQANPSSSADAEKEADLAANMKNDVETDHPNRYQTLQASSSPCYLPMPQLHCEAIDDTTTESSDQLNSSDSSSDDHYHDDDEETDLLLNGRRTFKRRSWFSIIRSAYDHARYNRYSSMFYALCRCSTSRSRQDTEVASMFTIPLEDTNDAETWLQQSGNNDALMDTPLELNQQHMDEFQRWLDARLKQYHMCS